MAEFIVRNAGGEDLNYVPEIVKSIENASQLSGTGIAVRSHDYITSKILEGKSVIALTSDFKWAGFCYIESWGHNKFVANSGLVVEPEFRGNGLAKAIKKKAMNLSFEIFPGAKLFGLTTSLAVMKINSDLGYKPVTFSELTDDTTFWTGCETCPYFDILVRTKKVHCLCTGMIKAAEKTSGNGEEKKQNFDRITII